MKRGDTVIRNGERYYVNAVWTDCGSESYSLVREGSIAHSVCFPMTDLRSHEPPRNSGEGTAVNGPMPLGEKDELHEPA